jgi:dipeptidyl aminopeptidase/acylaminoacyl peptidase
MVERLPYGSWPSPLHPGTLVVGAARLGDIHVSAGITWWSEARPGEGGHEQIVQRDPDGTTQDILPAGWSARTRVHEYGGAAWWVSGETVYFTNFADQRLYRIEPGRRDPVSISPQPGAPHAMRYADGVLTPDGRWVILVRERHEALAEVLAEAPVGAGSGREVYNEVVALAATGVDDAGGTVTVLVSGHDFVASPRVSPDGRKLAWLAWNHPDMPWDSTELWVGDLVTDASGRPAVAGAQRWAGGCEESLVQPEWGADGQLHVVSDATGWWNVYRVAAPGELVPVYPVAAEVGQPAWTLGQSQYQVAVDGTVWLTYSDEAGAHLVEVPPGEPPRDHLLDRVALRRLRLDGDRLVVIATEAVREPAVIELTVQHTSIDQRERDAGRSGLVTEVLRPARETPLEPGEVSRARRVDFPSASGRTAHAWFYPPSGRGVNGRCGELPPLLVGVHGGPTAACDPSFRLGTQFWTSRGFALVEVDYGGSTGYGRPYRRLLDGAWGVVDVEDACAAARWLAEQGLVDGRRMAIRGGSAGGFTALLALSTTDVFSAGASQYGVTDLAALVRDTHKFESRYLDRLVGPWPEAADVYAERSPLRHLDGLDVPLIVLQGLRDEVVPPSQAEQIVSGLRARGVPHAYLTFPDEMHGFRQSGSIVRAVTAELYFYSRIFGFELADDVEPVEITPAPVAL